MNKRILFSISLKCALLALLILAGFSVKHHQQITRPDAPKNLTAAIVTTTTVTNTPAPAEAPEYSHAIVKHGIHTPAELFAAYGVTGKFTTIKKGVWAYTTYRRGGKIYWTKHPIFIPAGTEVIETADGKILQRCGNQISLIEQTPEEEGPDAITTTLANPLTDDMPPVAGPETPLPILPVTAFIPPSEVPPPGGGYFYCCGGGYIPVGGGSTPPTPPISTPEPRTLVLASVGLVLLLSSKKVRRPL